MTAVARIDSWTRTDVAVRRHWRPLAMLAICGLLASWAYAIAYWYATPVQRVGTLRFPISCDWRAQQDFTEATSLLHQFQFSAAEALYRAIADREPDCAIANWGIAMSRRGNPLHAAPSERDRAVALEALRRADNAPAATARERAYIAAVETLFNAPDRLSWEQREVAFAAAMGNIASSYPDDLEATIFQALALNAAGRLPGSGASERSRGAELLLYAFSKEPDHPGIDHYLAFCIAHSNYQPTPVEKEVTMTRTQRISLVALSLIALLGVGAIATIASDMGNDGGSATGIGGPFALVADDGSVATDRSFRPRWLLVYFGYTHCPDICPTTLAALSEVLDALGPLAAQVQPLFITIDPGRDDRQAVHAFVKALDPRIVGLTGTRAEIAAVARAYRVFYKKVPTQDGADYFMEHSSYVYVMRPDGHYVTLFSTDELGSPPDVAARLGAILTPTGRDQSAGPG